jgi:hypothetical protein
MTWPRARSSRCIRLRVAEGALRPRQGRGDPGLRLPRVQPLARRVAEHLADGESARPRPYAAPAGSDAILAGEYGGPGVRASASTGAVAPELRQTATSVLAINRLEDFGSPTTTSVAADQTAKRAAFQALYGQAGGRGCCRSAAISAAAGSRLSSAARATRTPTRSTKPNARRGARRTTTSAARPHATSVRSRRSSTRRNAALRSRTSSRTSST